MRGPNEKRALKLVTHTLLLTFSASLMAPVVHAQQATASSTGSAGIPVDTQVMTQNATKGLSTLWGAWVKTGASSSTKPTRGFALDFFKGQGATEAQATTLVNNAQAVGQLNQPMPSSQTGMKAMFGKIFGLKSAAEAAPAQAAGGAPAPSSLMDRVKGALTSLKERTLGPSPSATAVPAPATSGSGHMPTGAQPAPSGTAMARPSATGGAPARGGIGGFFDSIKNKFKATTEKASLVVNRGTHDVGAGVSTAFLTAKDALNLKQFYNIPINQNAAVHLRGGSSYTTQFVDKGPMGMPLVRQEITHNINAVDAIAKNEMMGKINQLQTQAGAATAQSGPLGRLVGKFTDSINNLRAKITGKGAASQLKPEITKLEVQSNLIEHAQALTQAERSINARIDKLNTDASSLRRPVPSQEISDLQKALKDVQKQKESVLEKANTVTESSASSIVKSGVQWAMYSVGITASVNIIKQVVSGEKVDFKKAMSFVGEPSFWAGTAGGFIGSMVVSRVAASLIPGGGMFMAVLPGFLGAALGYEAGASIFGGGSGDLLGTIGQTVASAGGYALTTALIGGAGIPALLGAVGAGVLFNLIYSKLRGGPESESGIDLPPPTLDPSANPPMVDPNLQAGEIPLPSGTATSSEPVDTLMTEMQTAYAEYIQLLKDQKVKDARVALERYNTAKGKLDAARQSAVAGQ